MGESEQISKAYVEAVMTRTIRDRLLSIYGLTDQQLAILQPLFKEVSFREHEVIFNQGDAADQLFFVLHGKVAIRFNPEDGPILTVSEVGEGDVFGWSAALGSRSYTSSAVCLQAGTFLTLEGADLKTLYQDHPETGILILNRLADVIAQRLRGTHEQVVEMLYQGLNHNGTGGTES